MAKITVHEAAVRQFAKDRGLTMTQLARRMDRERAYFTHQLRGRKPMSFRDLVRLAAVLDVEPESIAIIRGEQAVGTL